MYKPLEAYQFYCMALFHSQKQRHMIMLIRLCYLSHRPLVKSAKQKNDFLISEPKHMLWVLKRTVSMRRFF